jgi:SAM-dependent methyltransferase
VKNGDWWRGFFDETYQGLWSQVHDAHTTAEEAQSLLRHLNLEAGQLLLDAPCGNGRMIEPLREAGLLVVGLDHSDALLRSAECKTVCVRGDLRALPFRKTFDASINLFSSFGYGSKEDDEHYLDSIAGALRPGGRLFLETLHRDAIIARIALGATVQHCRGALTIREDSSFDPLTAILNVEWRWQSPTFAGKRRAQMRIYSLIELNEMLESAGFMLQGVFAGCSQRRLAPGDTAPAGILATLS